MDRITLALGNSVQMAEWYRADFECRVVVIVNNVAGNY